MEIQLNYLGEEHIRKIVDSFEKFEDTDDFMGVAKLDEIKENDHNLNVILYVFQIKEEEIDVKAEWEELRKINEEMMKVDKKTGGYLREWEGLR